MSAGPGPIGAYSARVLHSLRDLEVAVQFVKDEKLTGDDLDGEVAAVRASVERLLELVL